MKYCDRCAGTTKFLPATNSIALVCTRCINGYLAANYPGCVTSCKDDCVNNDCVADTVKTFLAVPEPLVDGKIQKYCVKDCLRDDTNNVPLAGHNMCVLPADCTTHGQFLSITGKECVPNCANTEYVHTDGNTCK